jgi:hypothetical protein
MSKTANRSGWAYGDISTGTGEWLTILGSALRTPPLYATKGEAEAALDASGLRESKHMIMAVRYVTEVPHSGVSHGYAYRIQAAWRR